MKSCCPHCEASEILANLLANKLTRHGFRDAHRRHMTSESVLKGFMSPSKSSRQSVSMSQQSPETQFPEGDADGPRWMVTPSAGGVQCSPKLGESAVLKKAAGKPTLSQRKTFVPQPCRLLAANLF